MCHFCLRPALNRSQCHFVVWNLKVKKRLRLLMNHVFTLQWLNVDSGQLTTSFLAVYLPLPASVKDDASFTIALSVPIRIAHCWTLVLSSPSTTLGYRQVMSAKLNFLRYLTWWVVTFETVLLIAICVKDRHCHGKFTTPGLNQFFCYNYKIGATFFLGASTQMFNQKQKVYQCL